jgi:tRNA nucleotidyltransferase (CCA-adding enzyme)
VTDGIRHDLHADDVLAHVPAARAVVDAARASNIDLDHTWIVGGAVRDAMLGRPVLDLDVAVEGDAHVLAADLARAVGGRIVATHTFGTATIAVEHEDATVAIDFASCRSERYEQPGALPSVTTGATIHDDLGRRDVSINAMALPLAGGALLDPFGGSKHLDVGEVHVLHDSSFIDDPTRVFRAVRYAARYGFELAVDTRELAKSAIAGGALATISTNRIGAELQLQCADAGGSAWELLDELGVLEHLDARLEGSGVSAGQRSENIDALAFDAGQQDAVRMWRLRCAALLWGIGAADASTLCRRYGMRAHDADAIAAAIAVGSAARDQADAIATAPLPEIRRLLPSSAGPDELLFAASLVPASVGDALDRYRDGMAIARLNVTGHDIHALGVERGPGIGQVLEDLYDRVLDGECDDREAQLAMARSIIATGSSS